MNLDLSVVVEEANFVIAVIKQSSIVVVIATHSF
jgi:hypothetical protein